MSMDCRRVARELLEFFRFGELDVRSAPHLDHLEVCRDCREVVGLDRELVAQLRRALQARVAGHAASPGAWVEIRRRALEPDPVGWRNRLLPVLRLAPIGAVAVLALALIAPVSSLSPFHVRPSIVNMPTWPNFEERTDGEYVDPFGGKWWLRYTTPPPPSAPPTRELPAVDAGARVFARTEPATRLTP